MREMWSEGRDGGESGARLALMTGAPRATQVQLSPLPTSAMSDQHNKTQCVSQCSQEQLGGLVGERKRKESEEAKKQEEKCASPEPSVSACFIWDTASFERCRSRRRRTLELVAAWTNRFAFIKFPAPDVSV